MASVSQLQDPCIHLKRLLAWRLKKVSEKLRGRLNPIHHIPIFGGELFKRFNLFEEIAFHAFNSIRCFIQTVLPPSSSSGFPKRCVESPAHSRDDNLEA